MRHRLSPYAVLACLAILSLPTALARAQLDAWAEGADDSDDGATRDFYNRGAGLSWRQVMGDWRDRDGALHGDAAWSSARIEDTDTGRYVEWDVTDLVAAWASGTERELGFFLRPLGGGGPIVFSSREGDPGQAPELEITSAGGSVTLEAIADTHLASSTFQQSGEATELRVGSSNHLLVRFDLSAVTDATRATLRLYTTRQFGGGLDVGVFNVVTGVDAAPAVEQGIAAAFTMDDGLSDHASVVLFEGFEADDWMSHWTSHGGDFDVVDGDASFGFMALTGRALRVRMPEGENTALNTRFDFMDETGAEPDEIYFRYYLRFGDDWNQSVDGGKLPGISGTYGTAGWGGRRSDGTNGWSARGLFRETVPNVNNVLGARTPIGSYVYHADMPSTFGENFLWTQAWGSEGRGGVIEPNRWVCLETYVRMNTPGETDGVIRAWVDGVLSYETTTIRFRTVDTLHVERIWMNIYHGGTAVSPYDQHAFIDHVVIASEYVGPMGGLTPPPSDAGVPGERDAGLTPGTDGGRPPDGADAGPAGPDDGGCGCRAAGAGAERSAPILGLIVVAWAWRRRRPR